MPNSVQAVTLSIGLACLSTACATSGARLPTDPDVARVRVSVLARSQVWTPTRIRQLDVKAGPPGRGAYPFGATVTCSHVDTHLGGRSPKFICRTADNDSIKVKFGADNGEVFGEVLATRLLWALGFGADRMYPVRVICHGCPPVLGGIEGPAGDRRFDPAVIERPMAGHAWEPAGTDGWAWNELNVVNPKLGGATLAQRDALKLLAVFLQHTDSKPEQQRMLCRGDGRPSDARTCRQPFLMISDLGLTFGRANAMNANETGGANLAGWRGTRVWKDDTGCTGNLPRSLTGSLDDPVISEEGRRFLADLLGQLSDRQLSDLFEVARVTLRPRSPADQSSGHPTVSEWVEAFKEKRAEIATRHCR
ncbi:MAG: hypothetical protein ABIT71_23635 [Vicinamibacteraceae bacterium]